MLAAHQLREHRLRTVAGGPERFAVSDECQPSVVGECRAIWRRSVRSAYRLMNGTLTLTPVGSITHSLSESDGTLSLDRPRTFHGEGAGQRRDGVRRSRALRLRHGILSGRRHRVLFDLGEKPWMPSASSAKPLTDDFHGPTIDTRIWNVDDPGAAFTLTSAGLTCGGGGSIIGATVLSAISNLELGGGLVVEAGGVQFGAEHVGHHQRLLQCRSGQRDHLHRRIF